MTAGHSLLSFDGNKLDMVIGNNLFVDVLSGNFRFGASGGGALFVDGAAVLGARVEDGELLVSAKLRDADNKPMLILRDNELSVATGTWDYDFIGNTATLWNGERDIGIELVLEEKRLSVTRGHFWANGLSFHIVPEDRSLKMQGVQVSRSSFLGPISAGDWLIGEMPPGTALTPRDDHRFSFDPDGPVPSFFAAATGSA